MAEALARGFISKGVCAGNRMVCTDPSDVRLQVFEAMGIKPAKSNTSLAQDSDIIFVAVKPQYVKVVLNVSPRMGSAGVSALPELSGRRAQEIRPVITENHLIISIAAGVTVEALEEAAGPLPRVIRVMPNTPCLVGETASAMCLGSRARPEDEAEVKTLFSAVGKIYTCGENLLSAVTGLSGSGPAYVFLAIEALADGGVRAGLPRDMALNLAAQTVLGSAKMVLDTGKHPGVLKDMVTSPGGTTIAGLHELEKAGVRAAFMNAVYAASNRANELSKM